MANQYFDPGEQRASKVHALFERIATRYDLINDLQSFGLHRHWKRLVLKLAAPQAGQRSLDICCGTGDLTTGLARERIQAVGLDFSPNMLSMAAKRNQHFSPSAKNLGMAEQNHKQGQKVDSGSTAAPVFLRADAHRIPFRDGSFQIVTVGYGLRNLASWKTGLSEMHRVTAPGGRLLVLDFGKPGNPLWRAIYFTYLRLFVPVLGLIFCGSASAYAYILESLRHYPAQLGVAAKMEQLGLINVRIINLLGGAMSINYAEKRK